MVQGLTIAFPSGEREVLGYLARPEGDGPFPSVIIIHEIYGLTDNIKNIAHRFAEEGYAALAVDLFSGRNRTVCMFRFMGQMIFKSQNNESLHDLQSSLTFLETRPEVDKERIGAIGFCMGGGFAIAWACNDERLKVVAPFYGMNPRPLESVKRSCPVVGSYPENDFTASQGRKLEQKLKEYTISHDIKIYPEAKHSFFNEQGQAYQAEASQDAWQRVLTFFSTHIGEETA
ncbi:carboxymethylenebutenolidase [Ktedonospora formicarum]|uniref:Carboxymethylenebutenolidase n=2 Tax=Ktedonospora formicarum TaxID=2778364 RepID=A0A8J3HYF1_9CHLR|nr:carboxymethylenebutenolidase [Ktedonospora formicarum]